MPFPEGHEISTTCCNAEVPVVVFSERELAVRDEMLPAGEGSLSGVERQRAALAKPLLANPVLFLADEPTGNLDLQTSEKVFDLMRECHNKRGLTSVIVTHNPDLAARCDRVYEMQQHGQN
jgi:ABC-type lipoprotein export system ATPase subunit